MRIVPEEGRNLTICDQGPTTRILLLFLTALLSLSFPPDTGAAAATRHELSAMGQSTFVAIRKDTVIVKSAELDSYSMTMPATLSTSTLPVGQQLPIIPASNYRNEKQEQPQPTAHTKSHKSFLGVQNRILDDNDHDFEKNRIKKYEGPSTASGASENGGENESAFSDMALEEFYRTPMSFGTENLTLVTVQIGATAFLPCRIHYIGDGVVSWIRRKDYHLLTVALTTYSSDERFSVKHLKTAEDWTLQIRYAQARDSGTYECQVSSHPPTSIFINLNVIEARAEIIGPPLRYLTPDSTLRLTCRVLQNTEAVAFLFWYHGERMINYDTGINISTTPDFRYSELTIDRATVKHSGNYSCVPCNSQPASVLVHVFKGDIPAAMHHDHTSCGLAVGPPPPPLLVLITVVTAVLITSVLSRQQLQQQPHLRERQPRNAREDKDKEEKEKTFTYGSFSSSSFLQTPPKHRHQTMAYGPQGKTRRECPWSHT